MASLAEIYDWFMTGKKPTQPQFWASWGSFWNKGEQIPQSSISGLPGVLNAKAEKAQFDAHKTDENSHAGLFAGKEDKTQKGVAGGYVPLDEFVKIANEYLTIVNDLVTGGATSLASAETVKTLKTQIDGINTLLTSNDVNLDTVQEIVDAIKTVETSLSTILVNDLTTGGTTKALTAEMGKTLKGLIDGLVVPTATDAIRGLVKTDVTVADPVVYVKETVDTLLDGKANYFLDIKTITGITYNVIIDDILHELVYAGTLPMNVIIPNNTTVPFPIGTIFYTLGTNTGIVTASGASGVTLNLKAGLSLSAIQNEVRQYTKIGTNTWSVRGDLNLGAVTQTELSYLQGATSNIQAQINAKTSLSGGTANFLMKWLSATTATVSRIWETSTFLGIGTANSPTKDLTFGNQGNREIGIEESSNTNVGRDLDIVAGRAINYIPNGNFTLLLSNTTTESFAMATDPVNGNVYIAGWGANLRVQIAGSGAFNDVSGTSMVTKAIGVAANHNVYVGSWPGSVMMQTAGTGVFNSLGTTSHYQTGICITPSNNVYYVGNNIDIYMQTNGTGSFVSLGQGIANRTSICAALNGDVYTSDGNDILKQTGGTGNFVSLGQTGKGGKLTATPNGNIYSINASGNVYMQSGGSGGFSLVSTSTGVDCLSYLLNGNVLSLERVYSGHKIYLKNNDQFGTANLDGGTLRQRAGTGKGTGKSRFEIYTGQKLASGTDMQVETLREYIDENGYHVYTSIPVYANDAAADADANLPSGASYKLTGNRTIFHKP